MAYSLKIHVNSELKFAADNCITFMEAKSRADRYLKSFNTSWHPTDHGNYLGMWFVSFRNQTHDKIVVVSIEDK